MNFMMNMERQEIKLMAIRHKNVKLLCKLYFNEIVTTKQAEIIKSIAFSEYQRISVCAMTRWGKTFCVSRGIALYILFNKEKKVMFVGPQMEQAGILRDYMTDLVLKCEDLLRYADLDGIKGVERLKKEASRSRLTFKNGCEYRIFSAHGTAGGLMGFGLGSEGGIIVKDEACLIDDSANTKITRMLGDNPDKAMFVELLNPWDRDNKAFEHYMDPEWKTFHVGWKDAIKEGRTTQEFIDRQRKEMTPLEFTVLYDSEFPEESEDSIFNLAKINHAINKEETILDEFNKIEERLNNAQKYSEVLVEKAKLEYKKYKKIISCDVADKGLDETVILWGIKKDNTFQVVGHYSEPKSENTEVAGYLNNKVKEFIGKAKGTVNIDCIGVGTGVVSMCSEYVRDNHLENVTVKGCHFGEKASVPEGVKRFNSQKSENYFRLREIFIEDLISIPNVKKLTNHLIAMKWKLSSTGKIVIQDPDKSPDFADALVYFVWSDGKELIMEFI